MDFPIWSAPLVPVALFVTLGIVLDRCLAIPYGIACAALGACLVAWLREKRERLSACLVAGACIAIGACYHHFRNDVANNDVRRLATLEPTPVRLRGSVATQPSYLRGNDDNSLRTYPPSAAGRFVLDVQQLKTTVAWLDVSGRAQVTLEAKNEPIKVGDRIEIVGRMTLPHAPANPGEFDYAAHLRAQDIGVLVAVPPSGAAVMLLAEDGPRTLDSLLAAVRVWGQDVLAKHLPERHAGLASALLLGEGSAMAGDAWDKYVRTGVIHVLAISGQQMVVLGFFLSGLVWISGLSRRWGSLGIAVFLIMYGLMTGGRPPVMRAAWTVAACCLGVWLQRPVMPANTFALAWIAVVVANPMDIFNLGCQLSFLAIAVLIWGTRSSALSSAFLVWLPSAWTTPSDPALQRLIDESRPLLLRYLVRLKRWLVEFYLVNAAVWLAVTPLAAASQHIISPVALLIGPPLVLLTAVALIAGCFMFMFEPVGLTCLAAWFVRGSLAGCELLVDWGLTAPAAYFFVPDLPAWWLWIFYVGLLAYFTVAWLKQRHRLFTTCAAVWVAIGLAFLVGTQPSQFRCTFLAVGHGGCTVLETPEGRVALYDAGAMGGPDVTRRHIAPYLWYRGIRSIDELLISHADLDHYNGVLALLERFAVRRVTLTPSFGERITPPAQRTMAEFRKRGIPTRIVSAGDVLPEIRAEVIHPPARGPEGNENSRSMVLGLRNESLTILLTGDLEGPGLEQVLALPARPVDVLMAPHHGSKTSNTAELAAWATPQVVISCQGPPRGNPMAANPYESRGATYLTTWKHGAVTIRKESGKWLAETHLTRDKVRYALGRGD